MSTIHFIFLVSLIVPSVALGAGDEISWYGLFFEMFGLEKASYYKYQAVMGGFVSFLIITWLGFKFRNYVNDLKENAAPVGRVSVGGLVETIIDVVYGIARDTIGEKQARPFLAVLCTLFLFIFVSNLVGLIPGFYPATENFSANLAMGLAVFLIYNYAGFKEHGMSYANQFLGPVMFLAPLILIVELISHAARPFALSLRLYASIFGDHLVLGVLTDLTYVIVPAFFMFFGLLIAAIQSFVFTLLSGIYISLAVSHDH